MRRFAFALAAAVTLAAVVAPGCSSLNFIKRRLPPPSQTPEGVVFRFYAPSARVVQLAGNWTTNNWLQGQAQTGSFLVGEMKDEDGDGIWTRTEKLEPARYQYKFVIDRALWTEDPANNDKEPDGFGGWNSRLVV